MNFTLTVSIGVTARIASATPAPRPANSLPEVLSWPFGSIRYPLNVSKAPNLEERDNQSDIELGKLKVNYLTADFGIDP